MTSIVRRWIAMLVLSLGACSGGGGGAAPPPPPDPDVYVSATSGQDGFPGTRASPVRTIGRGIALASARAPSAVRVQAGLYPESVVLASGVSIYGGYGADWTRNVATNVTEIDGGRVAVSAWRVSSAALDGVAIVGASATLSGQSAYGVVLSSCTGV